jgi:hypothetical protein
MHPAASSPRARVAFALMTLLLLGLPVPARPGDQPNDRATLKGLKTIMVVVEHLTPEAERDGLTKDQLQTDVEVRLRKAGIKVTSSEIEEAYLYLNVFTVKDSSGQYVYHIRLEFNQEVILKRNRNVSLPAPTWSLDLGGIVGAQKLHEVRDDVADMVDRFINAYLEQNPKP